MTSQDGLLRSTGLAELSPAARRLLLLMFGIACSVVAALGIRSVAGLLNPVLAAGFLALLLQPLLQKLRRPLGSAAAAVVALIVILVGLLMAAFIAVSLREFASQMPRYQGELQSLIASLTHVLSERGINAGSYLQSTLAGPEPGRIALNLSRAVAGVVADLLITYVIFVFALGGMSNVEDRAAGRGQDPDHWAARTLAFADTLRTYMAARAVLGFAAAVLDYFILLAVGVDYALLWAVLSFVFSFVPNIGFTLSAIPPVLLALLSRGWSSAAVVLAGYAVVNVLLDNVIGPRYIGKQLQIPALLSFLSVIIWTWLIGPLGTILAVPLTLLARNLVFLPPAAAERAKAGQAEPSHSPVSA